MVENTKKKKTKKKDKQKEKRVFDFFFLKDFFETVLNTEVLGSEIVSSATRATTDESAVSNQYGCLGGIIIGNLHRSHLLRRDLN